VRDPGVGVAYRIPTSWTVFDEMTLTGVDPGSPQGAVDPIVWLTAFDGNPAPKTEHVLDLTADYPYGLAIVYELQGRVRENLDISSMRNLMFPLDGFTNPGDFQVHSYNDSLVLYGGGLRGIAMDFSFRLSALPAAERELSITMPGISPFFGSEAPQTSPGTSQLMSDFVRFQQVVYTDPGANRVFVMLVGCSAECFRHNKPAIDATVNSWRVIPQ
jgi:hypothetical protein